MASRKDEWTAAAKFVAEHPALAEMDSHAAIYRFCEENKHTSKTLWPKVKTELRKQYDIDYNELREQAGHIAEQKAAMLEERAATAPVVELFCAGELIDTDDGAVGVFALTDSEGAAVWYGTLHANDMKRIEDTAGAATDAVSKAIWIAGKVREDAGLEVVAATIHHTFPGIDREAAAKAAVKAGVGLNLVHHDHADENPAMAVALETPGYRAWQEHRLSDLLMPAQALADAP